MNKIKVSIAGGTGYTAGELLRILINHPNIEICEVFSSSSVGKPISSIHRDLYGDTDKCFSDNIGNPDVLFLCLGHGLSREFLDRNKVGNQCKIIDLGNDFRTEHNYGDRHFIYGLPEINRSEIIKGNSLANPGCFATAIQLALIPLAATVNITDDIQVHAITGSTGGGRKLSETAHFSNRYSNISVYKPFVHQHLAEIKMTIESLTGKDPVINFIPMRGDFTRGIFTSIYTKSGLSTEELNRIYNDYYHSAPFIRITDDSVNMKDVVNTNKCLLHIENCNGYAYINSAIDNLVKGASGQAVQNMNLMFSLDETTGLKLKSTLY